MTTAPRFPRNPEAALRGQIVRATFAHALVAANGRQHGSVDQVAAKRWPGDNATAAIVKASTSPGALADHPGMLATATTDFLAHLSASAGSRLMAEALTVLMAAADISMPYDNDVPTAAAVWVGEAAPIPVQEGALDAITLSTRKLGVILAVSRSIIRQPAGEAILGAMLRERAALAFDTALFSTDAGDAVKVSGLLNGVTALSSGPAGTVAEALAALAGALGEAGGSGRVVICTNPATAGLIAVNHPQLVWPVLASRAIPAGRIVAIDPAGLVFGAGDEIEIDRTNATLVHMSDAPGEIVTDAAAIADPVRELFQTDGIALRLLLDVAFAARSGAVQYVDGVTW